MSPSTKAQWRARAHRARRAAAPFGPSPRLASHLLWDIERHVKQGAHAAFFWSTPHEIQLAQVITPLLHRRAPLVCLPRVDATGELRFVRLERPEQLAHKRLGIWQPTGAGVPACSIDWVGVPGLAFSVWGERLGRGGGYYDRVIAHMRAEHPSCRIVGICHDWEVHHERVPREPHDQLVDAVVTPGRGRISTRF